METNRALPLVVTTLEGTLAMLFHPLSPAVCNSTISDIGSTLLLSVPSIGPLICNPVQSNSSFKLNLVKTFQHLFGGERGKRLYTYLQC